MPVWCRPPAIGLWAAVIAQALIILTWLRFEAPAPGLATALWLWPVCWLALTGLGLWLEHLSKRGATFTGMVGALGAQTFLIAAPCIVAVYALGALIIAWRSM